LLIPSTSNYQNVTINLEFV